MRFTRMVFLAALAVVAKPLAAQVHPVNASATAERRHLSWQFGQSIGGPTDAQQALPSIAMQLRFQLIAATPTTSVDPAIAGIDSVLKDLFRFPGYRLLTSSAISVDYLPGAGLRPPTVTEQVLNTEGGSYKLSVTVDTATSQAVRLDVWLYRSLMPTIRAGAQGQQIYGPDRETLLKTTVTISFGRTVILGSTQPASGAGAPPQTLILTVKPEVR